MVRSLTFEEKEGKTLVTSKEVIIGPLAKYIFPLVGKESLNKIHDDWLMAIKQKVENK